MCSNFYFSVKCITVNNNNNNNISSHSQVLPNMVLTCTIMKAGLEFFEQCIKALTWYELWEFCAQDPIWDDVKADLIKEI